jgi:hypothetical protein
MRLTEEQYADLLKRRTVLATPIAPAKPRKYRNVPANSADGKRFDSKLERDYYEQLLLRWKAGEVLWFVRQVRFDLEGGVVYVADFLVVDSRGDVSVIDTKGMLTPECRNKLKQVKARWGIEVQLVRKS